MRAFLHSTFGLIALALLLALALLHTCQLDRIERRLIELERAPSPSGAPAPSARHGPPDDARALAEPGNLLRPMGRSYVRDPAAVPGGTLRVELPADPRGMNVYLASGADVVELDRYLNNRLATRIPGDLDHYAPELAVSVTTPDDGLTYRVRLREGVRWQRPEAAFLEGPHTLTSDDFVYVLELMRDERVTGRISSYRTYFEAMEGFRAIDALSFELRFKERLATNLAAILDLSPMPRWLFGVDAEGKPLPTEKLNEHWYLSKGLGTGPYRFVSWIPGSAILLERNPDYWGESPAFDRVIFRVVKDLASLPRLLKAGELDLIRLQPEQFKTEVEGKSGPLLGEPRIRQKRGTELGYLFVGWNQARPYFADPKVRRAMTYALDRERVVEKIFHGLGRVTSGPFARESPCYDVSIAPWPYDLALAAKTLDEAGWVDGDGDGVRDKLIDGRRVPFEFELMIYASIPEWESFASVYRDALASVGVKMRPVAIEWASMLARLDERNFDAHTGSWVLSWDVDLAQVWHSREAARPKSSNRISFADEASDRIIEALRRELDPARRAALCHEFHARVHELQPYTFLYQRDRAYLYWDHLVEPELSLLNPNRDVRFLSFREKRP